MVAEVRPDSPAAAAGFLPGDRFVSVDGTRVEIIRRRAASRLRPRRRSDRFRACCATARRSTLIATPEIIEQTDALGNVVKVGVIGVVNNEALGQPRVVTFSPAGALVEAVRETGHIVVANRPVPEAVRRRARGQMPARRPGQDRRHGRQGGHARISSGWCSLSRCCRSASASSTCCRFRRSTAGISLFYGDRGRDRAVRCRSGRWKWSTAPGFTWCLPSWASFSGTTCLDVEIMKEFGVGGDSD